MSLWDFLQSLYSMLWQICSLFYINDTLNTNAQGRINRVLYVAAFERLHMVYMEFKYKGLKNKNK